MKKLVVLGLIGIMLVALGGLVFAAPVRVKSPVSAASVYDINGTPRYSPCNRTGVTGVAPRGYTIWDINNAQNQASMATSASQKEQENEAKASSLLDRP